MKRRKYSYMGHPLKMVSLDPVDSSYPKYIMSALIEMRDLILTTYPTAAIDVVEGVGHESAGFFMRVTADASWDEFHDLERPISHRLFEMNIEEDLPIHLDLTMCGAALRLYEEEIRRDLEKAAATRK